MLSYCSNDLIWVQSQPWLSCDTVRVADGVIAWLGLNWWWWERFLCTGDSLWNKLQVQNSLIFQNQSIVQCKNCLFCKNNNSYDIGIVHPPIDCKNGLFTQIAYLIGYLRKCSILQNWPFVLFINIGRQYHKAIICSSHTIQQLCRAISYASQHHHCTEHCDVGVKIQINLC